MFSSKEGQISQQCSSNKAPITWPDQFVNNGSPTTMTDQMFIKYLDINKQSRTEAQTSK